MGDDVGHKNAKRRLTRSPHCHTDINLATIRAENHTVDAENKVGRTRELGANADEPWEHVGTIPANSRS